jgi:hypothetical protein
MAARKEKTSKKKVKSLPAKALGVDKARNVRGGQANQKKGGLGGGAGAKGI